MTYEQAFHTCCRDGLATPTLAFQFQAASDGLDVDQLAALARQMVGYVPPPSAPPDPSDTEIAQFPISLRYLHVPGVGATVSQTVYIGREDRNAASGRFGNYFSHVLAALDRDQFDPNRHPIEAWRSAVWRTDASPTDGVLLPALPAGGVSLDDADRVLGDGGRSGWLPFVFDALEDVFADRTRIVVLDDPAHSWAWIAAAALRLPAGLRDQLTFDTYSGEPDRSAARLCVADPSVGRSSLGRRELTGEIRVVDLSVPPPPGRGLLARVMADGGRHLPASGRDDALSLAGLALVLATSAMHPVPLEEDDLPSAASVITSWLRDRNSHRDDLERSAQLFHEALDTDPGLDGVDQEVLETLWRFAAEDYLETPQGVSSLAARLALRLPERTSNVPLPNVESGAAPPEVVGDAISLITTSDLDAPTERRHLELLRIMGLVGVNSGLDRRIGRLAAQHLESREIREWLQALSTQPSGRVVLEHVVRSACASQTFSQATIDFFLEPTVAQIHDELCGSDDAFPVTYARAVALSRAGPSRRRETLEWALGFANSSEEAESLVDVVYGDHLDPAAMREVLRSLSSTSRPPSEERIASGWAMLEAEDPFSDDPSVRALAKDLHGLDHSGTTRSIYVALWLDQERAKKPPDQWMAEVLKWSDHLNERHLRGLLRRAVRNAFEQDSTESQHQALVEAGLALSTSTFLDCYWQELAWALRDTARAELAAQVFVIWAAESVPAGVREEALAERLVKALKPWDEQGRNQVGLHLKQDEGAEWAKHWQEWCDDFPAAGTIGRTMGKLFTRQPRD